MRMARGKDRWKLLLRATGRRWARRAIALPVFVGCCAVLALQPTNSLASLSTQNWTIENGLPQNTVTALDSSPDGYFWIGTELGLARFDGSRFFLLSHASTANFPDAEIRVLLAIKPGGASDALAGLWIGTDDGLVLWRDGQARRLGKDDGLPGAQIHALASAANALWVWSDGGLAMAQDGRRFHAVALPETSDAITSLFSHAGSVWVATTRSLFRWSGGGWVTIQSSKTRLSVSHQAGRAEASGQAGLNGQDGPSGEAEPDAEPGHIFTANGASVNQIVQDRAVAIPIDGALPRDNVQQITQADPDWLALASADSLFLYHRDGGARAKYRLAASYRCGAELPGARIETVYRDRAGALWIGTNHGLARWFHGTLERMPERSPISREAILSVVEDREGSIWLGTETGGLYLLRDARFHFLDESDGLSAADTTAIVEAGDHSLWVGTRENGLDQIAQADSAQAGPAQTRPMQTGQVPIRTFTTANGLPSNVILALSASRDGSVWVGTPDGLSRLHEHTLTTITAADNLPDDFVRSVYTARSQMVWIGTRHGLSCLDPVHAKNPIQTWVIVKGLGSDMIGAMTEDPAGTLWVATFNGLARLRMAASGCGISGGIRNFTTTNGLSGNVITALAADSGRLWVGTQGHGLSLRSGNAFFTLPPTLAQQLPQTIHGLMVDAVGFLWMTSDDGIYRAHAAEIASAMTGNGPAPAIHVEHFSTSDGLRSREMSSDSHPTILRSSTGLLWFTTPRGLVSVNADHFSPMPSPPPVVLEDFLVDDLPLRLHDGRAETILAGHLRYEFDYAGLSFAMPQSVQYAYKLEGFDRDWTDAGNRRTAFYTNIPPGRYRFRVRAFLRNPRYGGRWTETEIAFRLAPHLYQTVWFYLALLGALAVAVLLIVRWRLYLTRQSFEAIMAERNRIAREIHDTLAQGYVGVSVQLEVLDELLKRQRLEAAGSHLQRLKTLVSEGLEDARRSIWALRSQDANEQTLPVRLKRLAEKMVSAPTRTTVDIHGATRVLRPEVEDELLRIAQEAVQNVNKHARARHLALRLEYDESTVVLTVTDDGCGFPATLLQAGGPSSPAGHYGLIGMRERAEGIGAAMEMTSEPGKGTTVKITLSDAATGRNAATPPNDGRSQG